MDFHSRIYMKSMGMAVCNMSRILGMGSINLIQSRKHNELKAIGSLELLCLMDYVR